MGSVGAFFLLLSGDRRAGSRGRTEGGEGRTGVGVGWGDSRAMCFLEGRQELRGRWTQSSSDLSLLTPHYICMCWVLLLNVLSLPPDLTEQGTASWRGWWRDLAKSVCTLKEFTSP